ncbi:hypothetical protein [Actinoplanes sp. DH11]|uniref:hypothetical protein n=1 Tax=Actinoplanes sp. DH11 TaxID=2857011 RepID=UPI001E42D9B9|nr:hypothetical protein [Actinoplanes sp. DH11]
MTTGDPMTADDWPQADPGLERAYRRLLRAYPRAYRRRHGHEIVTTLLEMAEPGRRRPSRTERWHLIGSGLRQRFRLPAGRPLALVAAVLVTLIGGASGAAAGSWTAERTSTAVPSQAGVEALHERLLGDTPSGAERGRGVIDDSGSPWWGRIVLVDSSLHGGIGWDAEAARQQLIADGWQVGVVQQRPEGTTGVEQQGGTVGSAQSRQEFVARRDGLTVTVIGSFTELGGSVSTAVGATGNATLLPFTVLGALAGLVCGWLVTAAATQRLRHARAGRSRTAGVLTGAAVTALALPAVAVYGNVIRAVEHAAPSQGPVFTVHSALNPGPYWPFGPPALNLILAATGLALALAVLVTVLIRPAPAAVPHPAVH